MILSFNADVPEGSGLVAEVACASGDGPYTPFMPIASWGEVRGMPYESDNGHLIVLTGLTESGDAIFIDPALRDEGAARRIYRAKDLSNVWLRRKRGTAYVIDPRSSGISAIEHAIEPAPGFGQQAFGLVP